MKFSMRLAYLGKNYCGWQKQSSHPEKAPPRPSIQETVEAALSQLTGQIKGTSNKMVASGRTDAGVNAVGQIVHFICDDPKFTNEIFKRGLNSILPIDIRVIWVRKVENDFHAQRSAIQKQYSYFFQQGPCPLPHLLDTTWWIQRKLDVEAMREALAVIVGEHYFKPFQASGSKVMKSTVRNIFEAEVIVEPMPSFPGYALDLDEEGFSVIRIRLVGSGFLKQMVRGIAGTILQIGEGRRPASDLKMILETADRSKVGPTAAAKGLTLERVWYRTG